MVEKYIKNGEVAVLVAMRYGAGFSVSNKDIAEDILFNKEYVELALRGRLEELRDILDSKYPERYFGGVWDLEVVWVPEGSLFRIDECYLGGESLVLLDEEKYFCA